MSEQPDIDIQAEANQCHQWWLDQGTRAGPYHEIWQGWAARARIAAERERLLQSFRDMLIRLSALLDFDSEVDDDGITFNDPRAINAAFAEAAQLIEGTKALKPTGPSE